MKKNSTPNHQNDKNRDLAANTSDSTNKALTTNQGVRVNDDNNSLLAAERGPSLLEDFIFREKMTHFDHERIPERVVHARGSGAHGFFEVTNPIPELTRAGFLQEKGQKTPVFVRFSTVVGFRGSTDLARDARGFAVKFYTQEGVFDLVGNNIPVFFIQDAAKFPDLVHAIKPEPHNEIPQATAAHDTFWDFISLMPESMHMIMWAMSDRAIPRSYRMMEGFGVHTFRLVNSEGVSHFVKFHWKPKLGTHAVVWDEAQKISGKNPDFHRQDLWEAIEMGHFPEWELGIQVVAEEDEHKFDFDLLDSTKLIPEELVPVQIIGRMVLNRNPDNFFSETEQVAFHPGHIVPGIDFTNDPLLQGRLFSYTDTQLLRLGGPNFHEIPINRTVSPMHNNQRDGFMRQEISKGRVAYHPNSLGGGCPFQTRIADGGFASYPERVDGHKIRMRSESFSDHFSQAKLFYNSQTDIEKTHIIKALRFEIGRVLNMPVRVRMMGLLRQVDETLAEKVAQGLGIELQAELEVVNEGVGADAPDTQKPKAKKPKIERSDALSMLRNVDKNGPLEGRKVGVLCTDSVREEAVMNLKEALKKEGVAACIVAPHLGFVKTDQGGALPVDFSFDTAASVLFDAVYVPGGDAMSELAEDVNFVEYLNDAYRHCKVIGADGEGVELAAVAQFASKQTNETDAGLIFSTDANHGAHVSRFISAMRKHRIWERETLL